MKKLVNVLLWTIFIISFIPYLILVKAAIWGADVGLFNYHWAYGFDAVYVMLYFFTIIPIFPVCLLYELIYGIISFRKFEKIKKIIVIFLPILIVLLILIPSTIHEINDKYQDKKYYEVNEERIWSYLKDNFSDEMLKDGRLVLRKREDGIYWLELDKPVFDKINIITITIDKDGNIVDDFGENFKRNNLVEFLDEFNAYIDEYYEMDESIDLQAFIYDIDMKNYSYQDSMEDIFGRCDYDISSVYISEEKYNKDEVIATVEKFYTDKMPILPLQDIKSFNFYVISKGRFHASIHMYDKNPSDNELVLFFSGYHYSDEERPTIPSEDIVIYL